MSRRHPERDLICAVAGCTNPHPDDKATCSECWPSVPSYLRAEVDRAQDRADWLDACRRAVAAVDESRNEGENHAD